MNVIYFDIETTGLSEKHKVLSFQFIKDGEYNIFELNDYDNEKKLLIAIYEFLKNNKDCVFLGFNIQFFDIPFLIVRMVENDINILYQDFHGYNYNTMSYESSYNFLFSPLEPLKLIDYIPFLFKMNMITGVRTLSLETLAQDTLGEGKVDIKGMDYKNFYFSNHEKFIEYAKQDVILLEKIDKKLKISEIATLICDYTGVDVNRMLSKVYIHSKLMRERGIEVKSLYPGKHIENYGGYNMDPLKGIHKAIVEVDFRALYPTILSNIAYNEGNCKLQDYVDVLLDLREQMKKDNDPNQVVIKLLANSLYGILSTNYEHEYSNNNLGAMITKIGRAALKICIEKFKNLGCQTVMTSTDSLYITNFSTDKLLIVNEYLNSMLSFDEIHRPLELEFEDVYDYVILSDRKKFYIKIKGSEYTLIGVKNKRKGRLYEKYYEVFFTSYLSDNNPNKAFKKVEDFIKKQKIEDVIHFSRIKGVTKYKIDDDTLVLDLPFIINYQYIVSSFKKDVENYFIGEINEQSRLG